MTARPKSEALFAEVKRIHTAFHFISNHKSATIPALSALGLVLLGIAVWLAKRRIVVVRPWLFVLAGSLGLGASLIAQAFAKENDALVDSVSRNFYGVLTVFEYGKDTEAGHYYLLQHGRITHGLQFANPADARTITSYYGEKSGVYLGWNALPSDQPKRLGVVGLGTGTLSCYGRKGDYVHIYDINPDVVRLATSRFTYLTNCPATVEIAMGDARLSMENEIKSGHAQNFDMLALDAFSSDAIPVHLLTREAIEIYLKQLNPKGCLAVHVSNRYLKLEPIVMRLAKEFNLKAAEISDDDETDWWIYSSTWILLTRNDELFRNGAIIEAASPPDKEAGKHPLWTDDYASLLPILK